MSPVPDPTRRFTDRVGDYDRGRPMYPETLLDVLGARTGLPAPWVVADIGSGTGISTALLLDHGHEVHAVEPNEAMRTAAERRLGARPGFHSFAGTAEATGLPDACVDLVLAAQAFHWFDPVAARAELSRVLRAPGWAALVWNTRRTDDTSFLRDYEALLLEHGTDYQAVRHEWKNRDALERFFVEGHARDVLANEQRLDLEGLRSRLTSSSYVPPLGDPRHEPMLAALDELFAAHEEGGVVRMTYDCEILTGRLGPVT